MLVVIGEEPFLDCVASLRGFDAIGVLTDNPNVARAVRSVGAEATVIENPGYIEAVGTALLSTVEVDWLLLIDPDERLVGSAQTLRDALGTLGDRNVAGCWLPYRYTFLGHSLERTYSDIFKGKLVRPSQTCWPDRIHETPVPSRREGFFCHLPTSNIYILSEFAEDMRARLDRHISWAAIEARGGPKRPVDTKSIRASIEGPLQEYIDTRSCAVDSLPGILIALMHLSKSIATLLFEAELYGLADNEEAEVARMLTEYVSLKKRLPNDG